MNMCICMHVCIYIYIYIRVHIYIHINMYCVYTRFTNCGPTSLTMAIYQWKVQVLVVQSIKLDVSVSRFMVFSILWNLEVGPNAREGVDWLGRSRARRQRGKLPPSMSFTWATSRSGPD